MKKIITLLLAVFMLLSMSIPAFAHDFTDISGHWAETEIAEAAKAGIVNGDGNGLFRPDDTVTRAEYVKMLVCTILPLYDLTPDDLAKMYANTQSRHWCLRYYMAAIDSQMFNADHENIVETASGLVNPGTFSDDNADYKIERWEMAYMTYQMAYSLAQPENMVLPNFGDQTEVGALPHEAQLAAAICYNTGIIKGDGEGNFKPRANGKRAEAVAMINRLSKLVQPVLEAQKALEAKIKVYPEDEIPTEHKKVQFTMDNGKKFTMELYPEYAPQTVANFLALVEDGFYNGLTFHRITDEIIQGGDPNGNGTGGPEHLIQGEFAANGFSKNTLKHERGTVSMARSTYYDGAGSQFFICHKDITDLDGQYAAFGKIISGMENIDALANSERKENEMGKLESPVKVIKIKTAKVID